ncbi:hypothetical protein GGS23DRAFT_594410 [Durotheca rogersii]|uniref:uncharacterized protein n=1 Tax=Durotheca rogersii TaxID=419775 RepID=UPI00221ED2F3|nr:uncharacterized protein GGS23DRAFT_594410 [Durotheca rogersii]KAI5866276.1 hypothetical protein GGS23DRAFT_594410 [Durotheca rogersii]
MRAKDTCVAFDWYPFIGQAPWEVTRVWVVAAAGGEAVAVELAVANPNRVSAEPAPHAAGGGYAAFGASAGCVETTAGGGITAKTYEATARFAVGDNVTPVRECTAEGPCEFVLVLERAPVLLAPTMTACQGTCRSD